MNSNKRTPIVVGALFLIAMVTSLIGGGLLESIINAPDYLIHISENTTQILMGMFLELINGIAVIGIGIMMFPILKQYNENLAIGYVGFRIMESVFLILAAIVPLLLITLSQEYLKAVVSDVSSYQTFGSLLLGVRSNFTGLLIPIFFSLGALLFYYLLYQSKLTPKFIPVWGFIGVVLILILNLVEVNLIIGLILALPIILNEIFLGIWLIAKGFNPSAIAADVAK